MAAGPKSAFLFSIIKEAVAQEAADVILSFNCAPTLKVRGKLVVLEKFGPLTDPDLEALVEEVVPRSKLAELGERLQVDLAMAHGSDRFRVNVFRQRGHYSVVMRFVRAVIPSIADLGLPDMAQELTAHDNGLVLLVGPTGSGKSTSLAAMVEHLNQTVDRHIITIEDPIEYVYENKKSLIEQREVGVDALGFAEALRGALREAPDVILLGEMRDLESVSAAITVAETGHLVLSTVHANSSAGTIDRIIDIFPAGSKDQVRVQLADILLAVINQRLVPRQDGTGLMLICEVMVATSAVRNAIRTGNSAELPSIIQTGSRDGMYLLDDLLEKAVVRGDISKESALASANDRDGLRKRLAGG